MNQHLIGHPADSHVINDNYTFGILSLEYTVPVLHIIFVVARHRTNLSVLSFLFMIINDFCEVERLEEHAVTKIELMLKFHPESSIINHVVT